MWVAGLEIVLALRSGDASRFMRSFATAHCKRVLQRHLANVMRQRACFFSFLPALLVMHLLVD